MKPKKNDKQKLIVGLDIGTTKVAVLVGEVTPEGDIAVIGSGLQPSTGLKRGVVVNIESTVQSISRAHEEAELMAGCEIHAAYTGIAGSHIRSLNSHGIVAIRNGEVTQSDVDRVIDAARAVAIPLDQKILHILPQAFIIDNQEGIRDPIGMSGVRLEAKVHMVTGAVSAADNIIKCVRQCGLEVEDVILQQLASSEAVLSEDEKELGVCLVDIGGGTADLAIFSDGAIRHTAVIPIAGDQVTSDIAVALRTPKSAAEAIKKEHAFALTSLADPSDMFVVPGVSDRAGRKISTKALAEVVEARYEELLMLIQAEINRSGFDDSIVAGIVFTGGGSKVPGLVELAESLFRIPVRLGVPKTLKGPTDIVYNPVYATCVGLLKYGHTQGRENWRQWPMLPDGMKGMFAKMRGWFQGYA